MMLKRCLIILGLSLLFAQFAFGEDPMRQRVQNAKAATVRILVNGQVSGTGFAVSQSLVATNYHVVQQASPAANGQTQLTYAANIEVQLIDGRRFRASPHSSVSGAAFQKAVGYDVTLLSVETKELRPVKLGRFADDDAQARSHLAAH